MRTTLRLLIVVLGLFACLREAGSAACRSTCPDRPMDGAICARHCGGTCVPRVPCPLLDPTPQALIERAPGADVPGPRATLPVLFAALPAAVFVLDPHLPGVPDAAAPRGLRTRAGPLWLLDRSLRL